MDAQLSKTIDELGSAVEDFRSTQKRVDALEKEGLNGADVKEQVAKLSADISKVEGIKTALDTVLKERDADAKTMSELQSENIQVLKELEELAKKSGRPNATSSPEVEAHKAAFGNYLRKGTDNGLGDLQFKAVNITTDADGAFAVPEELDRSILEIAKAASPMRALCGSITVSTEGYERLVNLGGAVSGWVGETTARTITGSPALAKIAANMGEIYANPASTGRALDDIMFNVEAWLAQEVGRTFAAAENTAFTTGDGTNKPKGLMAATTAATTDKAGSRAFGTIQETATGTASVIAGDDLINIVHSLYPEYRANARWTCTGLTVAALRKLKDADGNYLWRPGMVEGQPSTLFGYGLLENEDMAEIADSATPLAFGDFARAYTVVDRAGVRVLRDPFTNKPYTHFYSTKRVGSLLADSLAVKFLGITAA